jgi:hypothetical protein
LKPWGCGSKSPAARLIVVEDRAGRTPRSAPVRDVRSRVRPPE